MDLLAGVRDSRWASSSAAGAVASDGRRAPTTPEVGESELICGVGRTVKATPLLTTPPTVTNTLPVVAPLGTMAMIEPAPQLVMLVAVVPLKLTVLVPWVAPKFDPEIVIEAPTGPDDAESPLIFGGLTTVNVDGLLSTPLTVTTTGPVVVQDWM